MSGASFLALGDSYTVGEGVETEGTWPAQLARTLSSMDGTGLDTPQIVAATGWTTDELAAAMASTAFLPAYDLVSLSIGVNDQYRGRDAGEFHRGFVALLERAVELAGDDPAVVMVVSIPDWGVTPFARGQERDPYRIAAEIDAFNALAQAEVARIGAHFVDVTAESRACGDDPAMLAIDGLHPSAAQYTRWLPAIAATARTCLRL